MASTAELRSLLRASKGNIWCRIGPLTVFLQKTPLVDDLGKMFPDWKAPTPYDFDPKTLEFKLPGGAEVVPQKPVTTFLDI